MDDDRRYMVLTRLDTEFDASVFASILEDRGIDTRVVGGHLEALGPMAVTRQIDLAVPEEQLDRAVEVLTGIAQEAGERELALNAEGRCVMCGYDMNGITDKDVCPECGSNLRQLAERFRRQGYMLTATPGEPRIFTPTGRIFAILILIVFLVPMMVMLFSLGASTFLGPVVSAVMLAGLAAGIWILRLTRA